MEWHYVVDFHVLTANRGAVSPVLGWTLCPWDEPLEPVSEQIRWWNALSAIDRTTSLEGCDFIDIDLAWLLSQGGK
jgi:hypothetical protein